MSHRFSKRSMDRARDVDPVLMAIAVLALARSPVDFGLQEEQSRTLNEQAEKVRRGVSKTMDSAHVIKAGASFSTGLDLVPYIDGVFQWGDNQWRVTTKTGAVIEPFYVIAAAMRDVAVITGVRLIWGGCWDRTLNDLPAGPAAMKAAVEGYKARRKVAGKSAFLDGPHFELAR